MYLFFDTETTGLPRSWKAPVNDLANWPRLVQLAWLLYDPDGKFISGKDHIIRPEGFRIPEESARVHGISTAKALLDGVPLAVALKEFHGLFENARALVAHNMSFDEKILGAEFLRLGLQNPLPGKKRICTMETSTNFCRIEGPYGYKWPKLSELHQKLFGTGFQEAHNAANDIQATAKCFWELRKRGLI
jgi:DNA polymerase III epsilon subunit-like protein